MTTPSPQRPAAPSPSEPPKKRAKYTQIACNECKRRKIKCTGGSPCSRCSRGKVFCSYPSDRTPIHETEFKDARYRICTLEWSVGSRFESIDQQLEEMQREMRTMSARLRQLEASSPNSIMPAKTNTQKELNRILNAPKSPTYVGPTSVEFGLRHNQPSSRLLASAHDRDESETAPLSNSTEKSPTPLPTGPNSSSRAHLGFEEALRLLQVYEDLVGAMYPCVDMDSVRVYVQDYYGSHESITTSVADCQGSTPADQDWFFARDIQVLKLLLATALLAESHGRSELAAALADNVEDRFAARYKVAEVDMKEILIMTLLSIFHSYRDDEVISWRLIRNATSACMELGLHRQETWHRNGGVFPGELAWTWANRLFWCIYVLDRKWSFGSGLPFGMQDTDIDTDIPEPGESTPYLNCLISHARLSTKIWGLIMEWPRYSPSTTAIKCTELDDEVQQWIWSIPHELRFLPNLSFDSHVPTDRSRHSDRLMMLQVLLALQGNQLRILVYRQNLQSKERIAGDLAGASIAVETAKSTIHMLEYFSSVTNIYFDRPEPFNYFLISALAALLLAVLHAPSRFSHVCRPEFYTAINLVRRSATRARTSRRLQKLLRRLEQIQLHKGGDDHQAVTQSRSKDFVSRNSNGCTVEQRPSGPVAVTGLSAPHGSWEPTPESARTSTSVEHPTSNYERPMTSWNTSSGMDNDCSNVCENLSSFFKNAGDLLFDIDPTTSMELPSSSDASLARGVDVGFFSVPVNLQSPSQAFANFEDDNEELTRAMAGLL